MTEPASAPAPAPAPAKKPNVFARIGAKLWVALASREARGPELALARIILAGLGLKLGVNLVHYLK